LYGADAIIRNPLFFRKKKKDGNYIKNIIIKAGIIKKTPYKAEIIEKILFLNRYCYRKNLIKRKLSYYYRKNVINENKRNIIIKIKVIKKYYYRGNVVKRKL